MVIQIDNNIDKKYEKELIEQINLGFELLKDYKERAKGFVKLENEIITETGIKFKNTNSLTSKKEKLQETLTKLYDLFQSSKNEAKKIFYNNYTDLEKKIKKIIDIENEFIKYKREKRTDKKNILENIELKMAQLETILDKKKYRKLLERINKQKYENEGKVYNLKHILGHLRSGQNSNSVNNKALRYTNLKMLSKKEKNMVEGIKKIRSARFAEYKEKKKEKQKEYLDKSKKKLKEIILKINKIHKKKLVGVNIPENIYDTIKKLKKQTLLDEDKIQFDKLHKQFNDLVSKIKKLQENVAAGEKSANNTKKNPFNKLTNVENFKPSANSFKPNAQELVSS
jgi:hypothetical protein